MDRGGHLSNEQTGDLLARVVGPQTKSIVLTHLSDKNNKPHLAESTVLYHIDRRGLLLLLGASLVIGCNFLNHSGRCGLVFLSDASLLIG